jgi:hypothetical protein
MMFSVFKQNISGIQTMHLVEHSDAGLDDDVFAENTKIHFAPDSLSFSVVPERSQNGVVHNYNLSTKIPKTQAALKLAAETKYTRYVIYLNDQNGSTIKLGRRNKGYRIALSAEVNQDQNSMSLNLSNKSALEIDIVEDLETPLNINYVITNTVIQNCKGTEVLAENIALVNVTDGYIVNHNVNSEAVALSFFGNRSDIIGVPTSPSQIKLIIPLIDGDPNIAFTGDIFIEKRNPTLS